MSSHLGLLHPAQFLCMTVQSFLNQSEADRKLGDVVVLSCGLHMRTWILLVESRSCLSTCGQNFLRLPLHTWG